MKENFGREISYLRVSVTQRCNLNCVYCGKSDCAKKETELSPGTIEKLVRAFEKCGIKKVRITGGEPLVRKDDVLTLVSENRDCLFLCYTNGTLIDDKFCEDMKKAGNLTLALSIEGNKETTDERRGEGVYDKVRAVVPFYAKDEEIHPMIEAMNKLIRSGEIEDDVKTMLPEFH